MKPQDKIKEEVLKEISNSEIDDWITDKRKGLHCSLCNEEDNNKLLNNPTLPRVLCIRCLKMSIITV